MDAWLLTKMATVAAVGVVLAGCGNGYGTGSADANGTVIMEVGNPQKPLIPGDTTEANGRQIVKSLWTPLVTFDIDTNELDYKGVAESIMSPDSVTYTVELKDGWTFHDGTPVTADSYIDAWNYAANPQNAMSGAHFFEFIKGYDALAETTDATAGLDGLTKIDDTSFTIELDAPFSQWPLMLGVDAFMPLPESFFADPAAFGKKPIGNGPFKASTEFVEHEGITLSRYDDFAGIATTDVTTLEYRVFSDVSTAYRNVQSGEIDVAHVPPAALQTVHSEFGNRFVSVDGALVGSLSFPVYDDRFSDKRVRQAFSMAVDREGINNAFFSGSRTPAGTLVPSMIPGARTGACEYCTYDPERAKALLAEVGFDTSQPVDIWFNAGAGHNDWMQAIGNGWKRTFGVEYRLRGDMQAAQFWQAVDEQQMSGPFRSGWMMDYPSMQNFMDPLFATSAHPPAGLNSAFYSNPEFDALMAEANQEPNAAAAIAKYRAAEDIVLEDMPMIPVYFDRRQYVHSARISNLPVDAFGVVRTESLTLS